MIQNRFNHRPRKVLGYLKEVLVPFGYKTPHEMFCSEMSKRLAS